MTQIKILSWNVNGIRAAEKKGFLEWLAKASPDVLCLQETRAHVDQLSKAILHPPGYHVDWVSGEKSGYCGVATFSKTKPLSTQVGFGILKFDSEGRLLVSEFADFTILNGYFPNGGRGPERVQYKLEFYDQTLKLCQKLRKKGKKLVISGDYNTAHKPIDLARPEANEMVSGFLPEERAWLDTFVAAGYIDTFRHFYPDKKDIYSWWDQKSRARDRNVGWRIDYHFVSPELKPALKDAHIQPDVLGSDHCPVGLELTF